MAESVRQRLLTHYNALRRERARLEPVWRLLDEHVLPLKARFNVKDNRSDLLNTTIINNTPIVAARVMASGMMSGITSPSRIWFRLAPPDPEMGEYGPVRAYLHLCEERVRWVFAKSNFYRALAGGAYPDLGVFGTNCTLAEADPNTIVHFSSRPVGEYVLAADSLGVVDTIKRELTMTVRQLVQQFGVNGDMSIFSPMVRNAWERSQYEVAVTVLHCISPNSDYEQGRADVRGKPWSSYWFERDSPEEQYLRVGGYEEFPGMCPRWSRREDEVYGRSPAMDVLGDCMALQHIEGELAAMVDKTSSPPMVGSSELRGSRASLLPADVTYLPPGQGQEFKPAIVIPPASLAAVEAHIRRHENRIDTGLFADLWLKVISDDRPGRATATEIQEAHLEAMQQLGPVLENLEDELLRPAVDRTFAIMARRGLLPDPPPELQGTELKVEFQSIMHQAQKATELGGVRTLIAEVQSLVAAGRPDALDKLNVDQIVDGVGEMAGVKPEFLLADDEVVKLRQDRVQRQQAMEQQQQALAATQGAKNLAQSPMSDDNALGAVLGQLQPVAGGQP